MEHYSPSLLATPPRHNSPWDSFSTDPTHFHPHSSQPRQEVQNLVDPSQVVTDTTVSTHKFKTSTYPSPAQQAALNVLQEVDNQVVLAWLTGLRSFRPDENHWFQHRSLSSKQVDAISVLKGCPNNLVSAWLDFSRAGGWHSL